MIYVRDSSISYNFAFQIIIQSMQAIHRYLLRAIRHSTQVFSHLFHTAQHGHMTALRCLLFVGSSIRIDVAYVGQEADENTGPSWSPRSLQAFRFAQLYNSRFRRELRTQKWNPIFPSRIRVGHLARKSRTLCIKRGVLMFMVEILDKSRTSFLFCNDVICLELCLSRLCGRACTEWRSATDIVGRENGQRVKRNVKQTALDEA